MTQGVNKQAYIILRTYYTRPASSASLPRPESRRISISLDSMTSDVSNSRYGPSGKPRELRRSKMRLGPRPGELNLVQAQALQRKRFSPTWSPHLWHDRAAISKRRSVFKAPSLDERAEGLNLNKRTIQIACFAVGFIFPFGKCQHSPSLTFPIDIAPAWLIASFLPLPDQPGSVKNKGKEAMPQTQFMEDLESQIGPADDARYENARWWRIINRAMTLVGISLIAVIVSLLSRAFTWYLTISDCSSCGRRNMRSFMRHDDHILRTFRFTTTFNGYRLHMSFFFQRTTLAFYKRPSGRTN